MCLSLCLQYIRIAVVVMMPRDVSHKCMEIDPALAQLEYLKIDSSLKVEGGGGKREEVVGTIYVYQGMLRENSIRFASVQQFSLLLHNQIPFSQIRTSAFFYWLNCNVYFFPRKSYTSSSKYEVKFRKFGTKFSPWIQRRFLLDSDRASRRPYMKGGIVLIISLLSFKIGN